MKGLTLTQPYATLLSIGVKTIETRNWSTPHRGWVAIHAAKTMPAWARELCEQDEDFFNPLLDAGYLRSGVDLPFGAIVAVANLHRVGVISRKPGAVYVAGRDLPVSVMDQCYGDFTPGRFGWVFTNVRRLSEPIPCRGMLGLFELPPDVLAQIKATVSP